MKELNYIFKIEAVGRWTLQHELLEPGEFDVIQLIKSKTIHEAVKQFEEYLKEIETDCISQTGLRAQHMRARIILVEEVGDDSKF